MKSKMALFWFAVSAILAAFLVLQENRSMKERAEREKLQVQVEQLAQRNREAESENKQLRQERSKLQTDVLAAEGELNRVRQTSATQGAKQAELAANANRNQSGTGNSPGGIGNFFENMLKNPEMREAMEQQQRMGLDMIYGSLFKQLQLTPEQEKKFKEILLNQQMANMSQAGTLFQEGDSNRAEAARKLADEHKKRKQELKELLGDEKFATYQEYNQTAGERMMLDQFGRQAEITPEQSEQLLAIILDEKKNFQINQGTQPSDPSKDWQKLLVSDEMKEKFLTQQEQINARVVERAGQVLTPEQLRKFEPILKNQIEMQRAGMKMARQMFGGANSEQAK